MQLRDLNQFVRLDVFSILQRNEKEGNENPRSKNSDIQKNDALHLWYLTSVCNDSPKLNEEIYIQNQLIQTKLTGNAALK